MIAVMLAPGTTFGQQNSTGQLKVLTVCEVLGDVNRYANDCRGRCRTDGA